MTVTVQPLSIKHSHIILISPPSHTSYCSYLPVFTTYCKPFLSPSIWSFQPHSSLIALSIIPPVHPHQSHPFLSALPLSLLLFLPHSLSVPPSSHPESERQTGRKCVMKQPYRAHCPNWPGMNGVTDQLVLKQCRWRSRRGAGRENEAAKCRTHFIDTAFRQNEYTNTVYFICDSTNNGTCVFTRKLLLCYEWAAFETVDECRKLTFLGLKSIVGESVISAEGGSDLHSRDFSLLVWTENREADRRGNI